MDTVFGLVTDVGLCGSIGLLLWGAAICLREFFESMWTTRAPDVREDREDSGRWVADSYTRGG
jgi:hypothetical protein